MMYTGGWEGDCNGVWLFHGSLVVVVVVVVPLNCDPLQPWWWLVIVYSFSMKTHKLTFHDMALTFTVMSSHHGGLNRSCTGRRHRAR